MGSDESPFNVLLIVRDVVTRRCPQTTTFEEEKRAEADSNRGPSAYHTRPLQSRVPDRLQENRTSARIWVVTDLQPSGRAGRTAVSAAVAMAGQVGVADWQFCI